MEDLQMSKTLNTKLFDIYSLEKDSTVLRDFTGGLDQLSYKRTAPKPTKVFPGMEKSEMKHTRFAADGSLVAIVTVSTSVLHGTTAAVRDEVIATSRAAVADTLWPTVVKDQRLPITV